MKDQKPLPQEASKMSSQADISKQIINLTVIKESSVTKRMRQTKKLGTDVLKKFKQHLLNKDFFCKLKLIMFEIDKELQMTRNGGAVSDNYINVHKD